MPLKLSQIDVRVPIFVCEWKTKAEMAILSLSPFHFISFCSFNSVSNGLMQANEPAIYTHFIYLLIN